MGLDLALLSVADLGQSGGAEPWRLGGCRRRVPHGQIGAISEFAQGVTVGCGRCDWVTRHVLSRGFSSGSRRSGVARRRCDRPMAAGSFASPSKHSTSAQSRARISGGELSRSSLVPLRPFGEPAQFRQPAGELGTSADRVHRTYLDSGAEERLRGAPARHSLGNSCSMSRAPSRPLSTPMCCASLGEQ